MKNFYTKLFCTLILCVSVPFFADAYHFANDLKKGDFNNEVLELQKILNLNIETRVASFGAGSPGYETNYFGELTKQAVIRFQEKYRDEILVPAGLSFGTGYVGANTKLKLNSFTNVSQANSINSVVKPSLNPILPNTNSTGIVSNTASMNTNIASGVVSPEFLFRPFSNKDVFISKISAFEVKSGDNITILVVGLTDKNILHIGDSYSLNINSSSNQINVTVPDIGSGLYQVWVENINGNSKERSPQYIKISDQSKTAPVITKSYPQKVSPNGNITLEGFGFDERNNTIYSTLGTIEGISSSGGKITFSLADFPEIKRNQGKDLGDGGGVTYSVKSSKGFSVNYGIFSISSSLAKKEGNIFHSLFSFVDKAINSVYGTKKALAVSSRLFDGGMISGIDRECTCSGSTLVKFSSYVDSQDYKYIYQPGVTTLYANQKVFVSNEYFLDTHIPFGVCLVYVGESCDSQGNPDGSLTGIGTS